MKNNRRISAFSLIEISVVILIIGILVAGVTQSSRLLNQAKLSSAKTMTQSSPISSIPGLSLWIETTSDSSFSIAAAPDFATTADLDDGAAITAWKDINPQAITKADFVAVGTPRYKTGIINGLPAVCFNDTTNCGASSGTTNYFSSANFSNISTAATIFAVIKLPRTLPSASSTTQRSQVILSKRDHTKPFGNANTSNIQFSTVSSTAGWSYCDGSTQVTSAASCNFFQDNSTNPVAGTNYVISVVYSHGSVAGLNFFENGENISQIDTDNGVAPANITSPLLIGKPSTSVATSFNYFKGYIGEIVIFDRALKKEDRQSVEAYLGKKWGIPMKI